jgi:signal transduction histidine kinase/uncharacterized membrane protein YuzA (DUF378 family)
VSKKTLAKISVERQGWLLWVMNIAVLLALTGTVPLLYFPLVKLITRDLGDTGQLRQAYYDVVGLTGLICIFCLYMTLKHSELKVMRDALEREEREKRDMSTRLSELSELFQVSTSLNVQFELDTILEIIVRRVVSALRAQQASIMIHNPETGILETRATYGLESEFARSARKRLGEGIAGWVAVHREALRLDGNRRQSPFGEHYKQNRNITSALSLPLLVSGRCVGVLNVNRINHAETFEDYHSEILVLFAEHVATVIERAEIVNRLGSRTTELEADNQKLAEMNRMKDVFLSTASHELKTPLTSIIGYAEILGDKSMRIEEEQRTEFVGRLRTEAHRLLALIEEVLDLSRIECGKLVLNRSLLSINDVARTAADTARSIAERCGATIVQELDETLPNLDIDEVKMRQVIVNLLVNAAKYSPKNGRITLRTGFDGTFAFVEVADQGPGIHPDDATHIFELFNQGSHGQERRSGGIGIGLHLVKRLSELHGGHVGLRSDVGGSTFIIRLPLTFAEDSSRPESVAEPVAA